MTIAAKVAWDDTVLPFQLDRSDIRGRVARLDGTLGCVLNQHDYPPEVAALVAEAAVLTVLIGQAIKLRWKLSLQIRGNGPVRLVATDYFGPTEQGGAARVRAYASYDTARLEQSTGTPFENIGDGIFAVLIDQGQGTTPYQGVTPLAGGSLAKCAETYFDQSEQLATRFSLSLGEVREPGGKAHWRAGGIMLQQLPVIRSATQTTSPEDKTENWNRATILLDSVEEIELIGPHVTPDRLLVRLFHEESPRVFDAQPVHFGCTCGADKVRQTMSIYSAKDIAHMTTEAGKVTADCQFCGAHYEFDPAALGKDAKN